MLVTCLKSHGHHGRRLAHRTRRGRTKPLVETELDQTAVWQLQAVQLLAAWQLWMVEQMVELMFVLVVALAAGWTFQSLQPTKMAQLERLSREPSGNGSL